MGLVSRNTNLIEPRTKRGFNEAPIRVHSIQRIIFKRRRSDTKLRFSESHYRCCPPSSGTGSCECMYFSNCVSKNNRFVAVEMRDHFGCGNLKPVRMMLDKG